VIPYYSGMTRPPTYITLGLVAVFGTAMFHNHLVKSVPSAGETLSAPPKEVRLWFNERPEIPFTSATLLTADSTKIVTIKATATEDSMAVAIRVATPLAAGSYLLTWRTASRDGHAIRGTFGFSIAP
jgi:methionine-rich copper-binding protein CopC